MKTTTKVISIAFLVLIIGLAAFFLLRKPTNKTEGKEDEEEDEDEKEEGKDPYIYVPTVRTPTGIYTGL